MVVRGRLLLLSISYSTEIQTRKVNKIILVYSVKTGSSTELLFKETKNKKKKKKKTNLIKFVIFLNTLKSIYMKPTYVRTYIHIRVVVSSPSICYYVSEVKGFRIDEIIYIITQFKINLLLSGCFKEVQKSII